MNGIEKTETFFNNNSKLNSEIVFKFKLKKSKEMIPVYKGSLLKHWQLAKNNKLSRKIFAMYSERRGADFSYNCHGMTFINRLGHIGSIDVIKSQTILMPGIRQEVKEYEEEIIEKILEGNGYKLIKRLNNIKVDFLIGNEDIREGDIIIYKNIFQGKERITHSGIIINLIKCNNKLVNLLILSKMGRGGEYFHKLNEIPDFYGMIAEIWTDRS